MNAAVRVATRRAAASVRPRPGPQIRYATVAGSPSGGVVSLLPHPTATPIDASYLDGLTLTTSDFVRVEVQDGVWFVTGIVAS